MIRLTKVRELNVLPSPDTGGTTYLSAASGLLRAGSFLYVVADDELHLGVFRIGETPEDIGPGQLVRLFDGTLPAPPSGRKKLKPDLEALTLLPVSDDYPHGAMLALGSGSRPNRKRGVLFALDAQGALNGLPEIVDLSRFLNPLDEIFPKLNIEGAVVTGGELRLFQRGTKRSGNAIIRFSLPAFLAALKDPSGDAVQPLGVRMIDLGEIAGIPLTFTDAAALPNGDIVFTAVAEDTEDTYNDGPCVGAAIGLADTNGDLRHLHRLDMALKIEGVDARLEGDLISLLLVTDVDDPAVPAGLFSATMSAGSA